MPMIKQQVKRLLSDPVKVIELLGGKKLQPYQKAMLRALVKEKPTSARKAIARNKKLHKVLASITTPGTIIIDEATFVFPTSGDLKKYYDQIIARTKRDHSHRIPLFPI